MAMTPDEREWRKQVFLDWLCTIKEDRDPPTMEELAEQLSCHVDTLSKWKKEPEFLARWEAQYRRTIGSPEKMQTVMQRLYETATDRTDPRQVQAAREYRNAVEGVSPAQINIVRKDIKDMSDDEFDKIAAEYVAREAIERGNS
jgi:hypothetical protein